MIYSYIDINFHVGLELEKTAISAPAHYKVHIPLRSSPSVPS